MYKILVVEDDTVIAASIQNHLKAWGCETQCVADFKNVLSEFVAFEPQLVLMDISLPFYNGYHWCAEIRKVSKVPLLFLSSASDNINMIMAMNMGADDFIAKPFDFNVLVAKIQAILRRTYDFAGQTNLLEHRGGVLNINDATLTYQGQKIDLSKNEYRILNVLMESKGKTVSRDSLMVSLWQTDSYVDENTLTVNVTRLRKKLETAGLKDFITTKKGIGYVVD